MKKLLQVIPLLVISLLLPIDLRSQCSTSGSPFSNCTYLGDRITAFSLNSIAASGNGGCGSGGYNSFSAPIWTLSMGNSYNWTASTGYYYAQGMGIWIDWNNDGQFANNEMVANKNYAFNHSGSFVVPFSATIGVNLKMRLRCAQYQNFQPNSSACSSFYYGETEDYNVYITCPSALPTPTVAATNTYICLGQSVTFTATGGQTYAWTGGITNGVAFNPSSSGQFTVVTGISACPSVTNQAVRTVSVSTTPLNLSVLTTTSTICDGTTATLTASGANNFTWMPNNATGSMVVVGPSSTTTYTIVGYNGFACPGIATLVQNVNPKPSLNVTATSSNICEGDQTTLSVSGALSYTWQQGGSNLTSLTVSPASASLYVVTGKNNFGCLSNANQIVLVKPAPIVVASSNKGLICAGASATLTATGAASYAWLPSGSQNTLLVTPASTTVYSVTGTGTNNCTASKTVAVNVYTHTLSTSPTASVCQGGTVNISAFTPGTTTYTWVTNNAHTSAITVAPATNTQYVVLATTQTLGMACPSSGTVNVTVHPLPTITASASPASICRKEKAVLSAGGANSYEWTGSAFSSNPTFTFTGSANATFTFIVTGTDNNGCVNTAMTTVIVNACTGISELSDDNSVSIYPNPGKGIFTVTLSGAQLNASVRVFNSLGNLVLDQPSSGDRAVIDIENHANGIYVVELVQNGKTISTTKIIKQ